MDLDGTSGHKIGIINTLTFNMNVINDTGASADVTLSHAVVDVEDANHYYTGYSFTPSAFTVADGATQAVTVTLHKSVAVLPDYLGTSTKAYEIPSTDPGGANWTGVATSVNTVTATIVGGGNVSETIHSTFSGRHWYNSPNWALGHGWATTPGTWDFELSGGLPPTSPYRFRAYFAKLIDRAVSGKIMAFDGMNYRELGTVSIPQGMVGEGIQGKLFTKDFTVDLASNEEVIIIGDNPW